MSFGEFKCQNIKPGFDYIEGECLEVVELVVLSISKKGSYKNFQI